jgi:hypothetical protein
MPTTMMRTVTPSRQGTTTMARSPPGAERILALLEGTTSEAVLEAAAEIAAVRGLPLVGLVIEDAELLSSAGLPFAREIGRVSGQPRALSAATVEARNRAEHERLRARLTEIALRHHVVADLEIGRGRRVETVLARLSPTDILVGRRSGGVERPFALVERVLVAARCAVFVTGTLTPVLAGRGAPMVLVENLASVDRVVAVAAELARGHYRGLALLVPPSRAGAAVARRSAVRLADYGLQALSIELPRMDAATVLGALRREGSALLCVARDSALLVGTEGERLTENTDATLVVVA